MLFSNPDYPIFLIAVFFLYALSRLGGSVGRGARIATMVMLGDLVFLLVAKDPSTLWDPLGGALYRVLQLADGAPTWPAALAWQWPIGLAVLSAAIALGHRRGAWIASDRGQRSIARGLVVVLALIAATVAIGSQQGTLDAITAEFVHYGHLLLLLVLGVAIGAAQADATRPLGRVLILFVASCLFYHAWAAAMPGPYRYLLALLLATIVLDYYLAIWIENEQRPAARKALVIVSLCSNLGILCFFKYTNFVTQDIAAPIASHADAWLGTGLAAHVPHPLHLILPAGISFHTFQSLSYTIDVYRKQLRATRSVVQFATFVLFFPQLVAGPIVRAHDLLPQLADLPVLQMEKATAGLFRIVVGLFKKIALADTLALSIVDRVFEAPERFSGLEVLAGVYGYALQIYLDFSAYSDIAIGSAQVIGFTLPENFRTPYRSANLQEFWRRWHITLSTWLRDYLYITLGGSRGAPWRTYMNLIITMLLGGLWHGASWAFVVWGGLHGFGLAITRFFQRGTQLDPRAAPRLVAGCAAIAITGFAIQTLAMPEDSNTWTQLVVAWLYLTPLWAVLTAWLGADPREVATTPEPTVADDGLPWRALWQRAPELDARKRVVVRWTPELLRIAMCGAGIGFVAALAQGETELWIPLVLLTWALGIAADVVERGVRLRDLRWVRRHGRRAIAMILVFHYVCFAWIFFRASSFDNALAVLRRLAGGELDHANLVPMVTIALVVGFVCHFFPDGSFRWLRSRFMALPAWAQGAVLAVIALVLRELGHTKIVPFIYFQF